MRKFFVVGLLILFFSGNAFSQNQENTGYKYEQTQKLVALVKDAALEIEKKGPAVFDEFKKQSGKWGKDAGYIFVLDLDGNMLMHPDPMLEGKNQMELKDVNAKPVIKEIIDSVNNDKQEGWSHYQWPEPGSIYPLWKTTFAKLVTHSDKKYIVGSGLYNMKMEREFIIAIVDSAAKLIEKKGEEAFAQLRDKSGPFMFMDTYVFVDNPQGVELVNGAFPKIEGRNLMEYKDTRGDYLVRDYINVALNNRSGWTNYFWPKPGQTTPSRKHTYVKKVQYGDEVFIVGSGAYLE